MILTVFWVAVLVLLAWLAWAHLPPPVNVIVGVALLIIAGYVLVVAVDTHGGVDGAAFLLVPAVAARLLHE